MQEFKKKGLFSIALIIIPILIYFFIFFLATGFSDNIFGISYRSYRNGNSKLQLEESKKNTSYSTYYADEEKETEEKAKNEKSEMSKSNEEAKQESTKEENMSTAEGILKRIYDNAKKDLKDTIKVEEKDQERIDRVTQLFFQ